MVNESERVPTIVTLTLNPALDLATSTEMLEPWRKLRCEPMRMDPGGGGVNVARVVNELGAIASAVVALGGHVGSLVADSLRRGGIPVHRVSVRGLTRQSFAVTDRSTGEQYRFVQPGAPMSSREWERCIDATVHAARRASCVVASSSVPEGVPDDFFVRLSRRMEQIGVPLIVDTSGPALAQAITAPITFAKPSVNELRTLTTIHSDDVDGYEDAARRVLESGRCATLVVSMGSSGALFVPRDGEAFVVCPPEVNVVSAIGAGDSMVAAIALSICRKQDLQTAARWGVAAGSAAVLRSGTSLCQRNDVERLLAQTLVSPFQRA